MIEKNIDKKLANRISYQINDAQKESFVGESKPAKGGGPYPSADMDWGGGSKSAKATNPL